MSVFVLGVLTFLRDFLSPVDSLAKLLAPCIAWAIIFLASAIGGRFGDERQKDWS